MIKSIEDYLRVGLVCFRSFFKVIENVLILQSILVSISFLYLIRSGSEVNNLLSAAYVKHSNRDTLHTFPQKIWTNIGNIYTNITTTWRRRRLCQISLLFILTFRHSSSHLVWHIFNNVQMVAPDLINHIRGFHHNTLLHNTDTYRGEKGCAYTSNCYDNKIIMLPLQN